MGFRNYKSVSPLVVVRESPDKLEKRLDELQKKFDFVDLQFSTHYNERLEEERYCALLLVAPKGELNGK